MGSKNEAKWPRKKEENEQIIEGKERYWIKQTKIETTFAIIKVGRVKVKESAIEKWSKERNKYLVTPIIVSPALYPTLS